MRTPTQLVTSFKKHRGVNSFGEEETAWLRAVFGAMLKVARRTREFTIDDIWTEIDALTAKGNLPKARIDHRVLGPMMKHMAVDGLIEASRFYARSTRPGSRPVSVWTSHIRTMSKVAA